MPPPSGLVAFLFTDIEGSTKLARAVGDHRFADLIDHHDRVLRDVWLTHDGFEVSNDGDSFLVAFDHAGRALAAAVDVQRRLSRERWPAGVDLRVRVGIHVGLAYPRNDNYHALSVHQAARVMSAANGNQVFLSADAADQVIGATGSADRPVESGPVGPGVRLRPRGRFQIRDFEQPLTLYETVVDGLPLCTEEPRALPAERHNLLRPTAGLLDRVDARTELLGRLAPGGLVSIVGTGGIGKTRLAVDIGLSVVDDWADGVWMVELDSIRSPDHLVGALARSARVPQSAGVEPMTEVVDHLRNRQLLLVLDNCEHLTGAVARLVCELLAAAPKVGVLATSREPLGLPNEAVVRLGVLGDDTQPDADVDLYLARCGRAGDRADRSEVAELCRWLDGVPLAIELAAARAGVLGAGDLVAALRSRSVRPRRGGPGPLLRSDVDSSFRPGRHRSLDDLLDWSYELLGVDEQLLLRRLSVFGSSVGMEVASTVAAVGDTGLDRYDTAELLWSLSSKSLVMVDESSGSSRFRVVRSIRPPLTAKMSVDEWHVTVRAAAAHYLERLGPDKVLDSRWVGELGAELDNVRTLLAVESDLAAPVRQMLAWSIGRHADVTGDFELGIRELSALAGELIEPTPERVALLTLLADLNLRVGRLTEAEASLDQAVDLHAAVGPPSWDDGGVARSRGEIALRRQRPSEARGIAEARLQDPISARARARLWNLAGLAHAALYDADAAIAAFGNELRLWEELGLDSFVAVTHGNLAEMRLRAGDWRGAAFHQQRSLEMAAVLGQQVVVAFSLAVAARLAAEGGRWSLAVRLQAAADAMRSDLGIVLYDIDVELRDSLLSAAADAVGGDEVERADVEGRALTVDDAISTAARVLTEATTSGAMAD